MQSDKRRERESASAHIARPASVVMLKAAVRAARGNLRHERINGLRVRLSDGGYAVSSQDLARGVLSNEI